jgi:hypothetical protein
MKCYYQLHLSIKFDNGFVDQKINDDSNLDIFQMTASSIEPSKEFVKRKLLVFQCY